MADLVIDACIETWPLKSAFTISRGSKTEARVVTVRASDKQFIGWGEAVPYARYGETPESTIDAIGGLRGIRNRTDLAASILTGAARNAVDCALWHLEAQQKGIPAAEIAGLVVSELKPVLTAYTLSLAPPEDMAIKAQEVPQYPLLKLKLGAPGDAERMAAVRTARPDCRLIVDANEGWSPNSLQGLMRAAAAAGVELIEQPLPAGEDDALLSIERIVPVCADESAHTRAELNHVRARYDAINIKLDKAGGLTEALALKQAAKAAGLKIMVGSMVATSLAVAPAFLLAQGAEWADLDGPLLLGRDRETACTFDGALMQVPPRTLWG